MAGGITTQLPSLSGSQRGWRKGKMRAEEAGKETAVPGAHRPGRSAGEGEHLHQLPARLAEAGELIR